MTEYTKYEYRFQVRLHDTDHAGVVFFARLFTHAHDAYESFMSGIGLGLNALIEGGVRLPVVHASADYLLPLRHEEEISVLLKVAQLGRTSFTVEYAFRCDGQERARLRSVHVFLDASSGLPAHLPQEMRIRLSGTDGLEPGAACE